MLCLLILQISSTLTSPAPTQVTIPAPKPTYVGDKLLQRNTMTNGTGVVSQWEADKFSNIQQTDSQIMVLITNLSDKATANDTRTGKVEDKVKAIDTDVSDLKDTRTAWRTWGGVIITAFTVLNFFVTKEKWLPKLKAAWK